MTATQATPDSNIQSSLAYSFGTEPSLGLALGAAGGTVKSMLLATAILPGAILGAIFGLIFGLFFARRASSAGAGLIWGLAASFFLWLVTAGEFFHFAAAAGSSNGMLQDAQLHFPRAG